jgi:hypothetical protein
MSASDFQRFLKSAAPLSVEGAFGKFLDAEINIGKGIRGRASDSQSHLREFLDEESDRDDNFPRVLSINDDDFIGGSFARHTKNWPLDDIDIYFPLDGVGLIYNQRNSRLPYTVATDGVLDANPLVQDPQRWMNGTYISSRKLIDGFAKVLSRHYQASKVRRIGEAVNVRFTHGEGEENDGLGFDIVPAFSLKPDYQGEQEFYLIPDGEDGWIRTNPRLDKVASDTVNRNNGRTLRKGVKLIKWWNTENLGGRLKSYYIELAVMRAFSNANNAGGTIESISAATATAFRAVRDATATGNQAPLLTGAPSVERGDTTDRDLRRLNDAVEQSQLALLYESLGRDAEAIASWGLIFGNSFPAS